jgi:hypothetical protein
MDSKPGSSKEKINMPTYTFRRKSTGEEWTTNIKISERDELVADPDIEQLIVSAPILSDSARMGLAKPSDHFRDRLKEIKRKHWKSNINTW